MLEQAADLRDEGDELHALLTSLDQRDWARPTPFKNWTVNDVVMHLHQGDWLAMLSLTDPDRFVETLRERNAAREAGRAADVGPRPLTGPALADAWRGCFTEMCDRLADSDPGRRLKWAGPDMGVRMFTTARQMETWAHGQDIYDLLHRERRYFDRVKNIAVLGVKTYGWTFHNRGLEPPGPAPHVRLEAPSGVVWEWNDADPASRVEGSAVEFCHVVSQGRNIADTSLEVTGTVANRWMSIAQCFAGPPNDPPSPGQRPWRQHPG